MFAESKKLQDKIGKVFLRRTKDLIADQLPRKGNAVNVNWDSIQRNCVEGCLFCNSHSIRSDEELELQRLHFLWFLIWLISSVTTLTKQPTCNV